MTPEPRDEWNSLRDAVARAIAANKALADETAHELSALAERLHPTRPPRLLAGTEAFAASPAELVLDAERALIAELADELKDLAHRQIEGLDTFNIVLFGRTGVGKSSLLEALSHGGGGSISPSDSDWTTTVNPVDWAHCRVVDTPGIEGWGRTVSREELEQKAREELVTADVVLLCFDSQNQKAGEFRKVADWIAEFNKPVVGVLNVRLPHWRFPTRVPRRAQRLRNSQTVADHAAHIHEVLTTIGLADAPIIATHTQRAVFARAREPFELPDDQRTTMLSQRAEVGAEQLLEWSNLPALEGLLATAVEGGAGALRRGALLNQSVRTPRGRAASMTSATSSGSRWRRLWSTTCTSIRSSQTIVDCPSRSAGTRADPTAVNARTALTAGTRCSIHPLDHQLRDIPATYGRHVTQRSINTVS